MAVGQGSLIGGFGYVALGRETSSGTYNTATAGLPVLSFGLKTVQEGKILEEINCQRSFGGRIQMGKVIEGSGEFYFRPQLDSCNYILQNAMGGTMTFATAAGETVGGLGFTHTYALGNIVDQSYSALCINVRKGNSSGGHVFEYTGIRVNELSFTAEIDEPLKTNATLIAIDSTQGVAVTDVCSVLSVTSEDVLSFVNGRFSVATTVAQLGTSTAWCVTAFNLTMINNLKADNESRKIGSDLLAVLPSGMSGVELSATLRFDTMTAYDAMISATKFSAEFEFLGATMAGSIIREGLKITLPEVYINDAGDPEIGGPDELLTSEVVFHVVRDDTSATGYAIQSQVTNLTERYNT